MYIDHADTEALATVLARLEGKVDTIMATTAEALAVLGEINAATDDIAADIEALMTKPDVPAEVAEGLQAAANRLRGVASAFPSTPVEPGATPGDEPLPA